MLSINYSLCLHVKKYSLHCLHDLSLTLSLSHMYQLSDRYNYAGTVTPEQCLPLITWAHTARSPSAQCSSTW